MIKSAISCLLCFAMVLTILTGCQDDIPSSPDSTIQPTPASSTILPAISPPVASSFSPLPNTVTTPDPDNKLISMSDTGATVYAEDLGIDSIGCDMYWAPDHHSVLFQGYLKDSEGKYTPGVYCYNIESQETMRILKGMPGRNYYLAEPSWSADSNEIVMSFNAFDEKEPSLYIYNIRNRKLEALPIAGSQAELSPEGRKIMYIGTDENIHIYDRFSAAIQSITPDIKGRCPIWFSDSRHILFLKDTGKNPQGLDGADLYEICILDPFEPGSLRIIGEEKVYQDLHWVLQDSIAWIDSGWDDGHYVSLLDLSNDVVREFGDDLYNSYLTGREPRLIRRMSETQWNVSGTHQNFYTEYPSCPAQGVALSVLPDNTLLLWQSNSDEPSKLIAVPREGEPSELAQDTRLLYPIVSDDGTKLSFIDSDGGFFIVTDVLRLFKQTLEENEAPGTETEFMNSLIQTINDENINMLESSCFSTYGTLQPEERKSLPHGLKLFKQHFNNEKLVDFLCGGIIKGRSYDAADMVGIRYFLISESGLWREIEIRRRGAGEDFKYQVYEPLLNFAPFIETQVKGWFDAVKTDSAPALYNYFSRLSEGEIPAYEEGTDPEILERVTRSLNRYKQAFVPESLKLIFTGFSSRQTGSLKLEYEITGLSRNEIPLKHRFYGIFEFPLSAVEDIWMD